MAWNSASFELILATILAVLFAVAGVVNLAGRGAVKSDFARWGYPAGWRLFCGALELVSAALLLGQHTRVWGLTLTVAIMIAVLVTLLRNREPFRHLAPALVFSALIVVTLVARC